MIRLLKTGVAVMAIVLAPVLAGCSSSPSPVPPPGPASSSAVPPDPPGSVTTVSVDGVASGDDGQPVVDVAVGFQVQDCGSCHLYTAVTNAEGDYSTTLPSGTYLVACSSAEGTCTTQTASRFVQISRALEIDLAVGGGSAPPAPSPVPPPPSSPTDDNVLSGYVRNAAGQPVPDAEIEIEFVVSGNVHVATDSNGYYAIPAGYVMVPGTVECDPPVGYAECNPVDDQTSTTIDQTHGPRVIDWVATVT
jgi:hypothetical protein